MLGRRKPGTSGSLAIVETDTVALTARAAEAALKGTPVDLIEIRLADTGLSGKGVSVYQGEAVRHPGRGRNRRAAYGAGPAANCGPDHLGAPRGADQADRGQHVVRVADRARLDGEVV